MLIAPRPRFSGLRRDHRRSSGRLARLGRGQSLRLHHPPPDGDDTGLIGFWSYTVKQELGPGPGISPPTAPTGPTLTALGAGKVKVVWTDKSNNEEGFEVQRQQKVGNFWTNTTLIPSGANTTTYTDTPGAGTFQYRVRSYNIAGSSTWTAWKSIKAR